jgi:hypothetical protein
MPNIFKGDIVDSAFVNSRKYQNVYVSYGLSKQKY